MIRSLLLTVFTTFVSGVCRPQDATPTTGPGIIESILDTKSWPCLDVYEGKAGRKEYVIDSQVAYDELKERLGQSCSVPDIDFSRHTLLGMYGGGNNYCSVEYRRHVEDDRAHARYIFTLTVIERGFCKRAVRWHWHWVLVPKIPESYRVEFNVIRVRERNPEGNTTAARRGYVCHNVTGTISTPGRSGIQGKTIAGPSRPVNSDNDTTDAYRPISSTGVIRRLSDNREVARFTSDAHGAFTVALSPGKYVLEALPVNGKPWPRPDSPCVVVIEPNQHLTVRIRYDTGIR